MKYRPHVLSITSMLFICIDIKTEDTVYKDAGPLSPGGESAGSDPSGNKITTTIIPLCLLDLAIWYFMWRLLEDMIQFFVSLHPSAN